MFTTFTNLQREMVQTIAKFLPPRDVISLGLASKTIYSYLDQNFWRTKAYHDYPTRVPKYHTDWKITYQELYRRSQIFFLDETVNGEKVSDEDYCNLTTEALDGITQSVIQLLIPNLPHCDLLVRGDVIHLGWTDQYRNHGKLMWDGEKVIELEYDLDDYGNVPSSMQFPEFPPDHFYESIEHNEIFHLSESAQSEMQQNFDPETQTSCITYKYRTYQVKLDVDLNPVTFTFTGLPTTHGTTHGIYAEKDFDLDGTVLDDYVDIYVSFCENSWNNSHSKGTKYQIPDAWRPYILSINVDPYYTVKWLCNATFQAVYNDNSVTSAMDIPISFQKYIKFI